jgi:hypothetical protein
MMFSRNVCRVSCVFVAALVFAWAAWALTVCPKCGHEAGGGDTVCSHCNAALPKPSAEAPVAAPAAPENNTDAEVGRGAATVVEACVRKAREVEAKQPELALCYYQNALALMRLVPAGTFPDAVEKVILAGNTGMMQVLQRGVVSCRSCGGTGRYQLDTSKVTGKTGVVAVKGMPCKICDGTGKVPGPRDVAQLKQFLLRGRVEFERRQLVAGDVRVGRALMPAALDERLPVRSRALVMTGMPVPCSECQLAGRQACTKCRGSGWEKCAYEGCRNGIIEEKTSARARKETRMNQDAVSQCPRCGGLGETSCSVCKGSGGVACSKCDGSGLAPRCTRCSVTGLMPCQKCKGTGEVKEAPCPDCKGEREMLCTSCRGEGALTR